MSAPSRSATQERPVPAGPADAGPTAAGGVAVLARRHWRTGAAVALTLVALAPALAAVVERFGSDYVPVQDLAILDLRVRDVWSSHIPLVGPYSKGWSHPGPLVFWLLALPSGLFGQAAWATAAGGALLQAAAIAGSARLAWRKGGLALLLVVLAAIGLAYGAFGGWIVMDAWNPHIALPFFVLYVLSLWALTDGARWAAVLATAVGSFLVQTHVGYLPLVVLPGATAVAVLVLGARRGGEPLRAWAGALRRSLLVAVLLWLPTLVEQLVAEPGNLRRMYRYFTGGEGNPAGVRTALEVLAAEFQVFPQWLAGEDAPDPLSGRAPVASPAWLLVPVALLVLGYVASRRSGSTSDRNLVVLMAATLVAGLAAASQVPDVLEPYLFLWRSPLAVLLVAAAGMAVARWLGVHRSPRLRVAAGVALAATVVLTSGRLALDVVDAPARLSVFEDAVAEAADQVEDDARPGPVLVRFEGRNAGGLWGGLIDELDRRGAPVRVDPRLDFQYGEHRTAAIEDVRAVWYAVDDSQVLSLLSDLPDAEVVASVSALPSDDDAELTELQRRVAAGLFRADRADLLRVLDSDLVAFALADVPGLDPDDLDRLADLNEAVRESGSCRCGVVAFPPGSPSLGEVAGLDPEEEQAGRS